MLGVGYKKTQSARECKVLSKRLIAKTQTLGVAIIGKRNTSVRNVAYAIISVIITNKDIQRSTSSLNTSLISKDLTVIRRLIWMNSLKTLTIP